MLKDPETSQHEKDQRWNHIGLPAAHDFTFARQKQSGGEIDTVVTRPLSRN